MTEKEKMLAGKLYDPADEELCALRLKCNRLCLEYNRLSEEEGERRAAILKELGIQLGEGTFLRGPIYFDYGCFTRMGKNCYANYNLTILDVCPIDIGDNVLMGTGVSILTPLHPMLPKQRNFYVNDKGETTDQEYGKPITIESNCWIASNVSILPGVRIGEGSVIGAGSVVTKDIPPHSLAAGNPCRVIREITEKDALPPDLF